MSLVVSLIERMRAPAEARSRYILIGFTAVSVAISIAWLGVDTGSKWQAATGLYIVGRES